MHGLLESKLLDSSQDKFFYLIHAGKEIAEHIYEKHSTSSDMLIQFGVNSETTQMDVCRIEHVISNESFQKLKGCAKKKTD